jgi:hypothetical protein
LCLKDNQYVLYRRFTMTNTMYSLTILAVPVVLAVLFAVAYKGLELFEKLVEYFRIRNGVKRVSMHDAWASANHYTDIRHK